MKPKRLSKYLVAALLWAPLLVAGTANAVDLRSWDRKMNDVTKRFVVLAAFGNQAVLDMETQLVWERTPHPTYTSWWNSGYSQCGIKSVGGRKGWRLPSLYELMTLVDSSVSSGPMLPAGHPFIGLQATDSFWTTSIASQGNDYAVGVRIGTSVLTAYPKVSYAARPWCVRGPSSPGPY